MTDDPTRGLAALQWVRKFIEYARYELQPGETKLGDQFPGQVDADKAMRLLDLEIQREREMARELFDANKSLADKDAELRRAYVLASDHAQTIQEQAAEITRLTDALNNQTERACKFNCDAESSCNCPAHQTLRAARQQGQEQQ